MPSMLFLLNCLHQELYKLLNSAFALLVIVLVAPLNQVQGIDLVDPHDPNVRFNSTPVNEYYSLSIDENVNSAILFYIVNVLLFNICHVASLKYPYDIYEITKACPVRLKKVLYRAVPVNDTPTTLTPPS
ncbi:hypothetical protein HHI36_013346 [Cryptolaemus montrouzieri]|uniref:Uncharacterized protein n=1 Tax=Cryptolaemus montrouzieri TaxID=559131 RepID=A0ABD2NHC4_9CUCU